MAGSGSGDGAKENDDLRLYKNLTREAGHELEDFGEFKGKREMDLCGSGDGAKVSKLVSEENQPRISEMEFADRFLQSYADDDWTCSDSDYSDGEDDGCCFGLCKRDSSSKEGPDQEIKDNAQIAIPTYKRELGGFRESKRKREMDLSGSGDGAKVLKLVSDENQPPKYENEFKDSDSDCQKYSDSDSDEEDGGWFGLYERGSSSKGPSQLTKYCAQLAIDAYNRREGKRYIVVDIIRAEKYSVVGYMVFVSFTGKLINEHVDDAITFRAEVLVNEIDEITKVKFVEREIIGPLTKEETVAARGRDRYRPGQTSEARPVMP